MKINFNNDYSVAAHPSIMMRLSKLSFEDNTPYGLDKYSKHAEELILNEANLKEGNVYFIAGGTQTNLVFLSLALHEYEGVIAASTGHINVHETGAIEGTGHKVIIVKEVNGKVTASEVEKCVLFHCDEHMVKPKVVYISDTTELGTVYNKKELEELRKTCDKYGLYLFLDGARLGSALTSRDNDMKLSDIANLVDAFYIGGTKNGLLIGEALVIKNKELNKNVRYQIKHRGAMLAKGFIVGVQFEELFSSNLFYEIGEHENIMASNMKDALIKKGIKLANDANSNQIFAILNKKQYEELEKDFIFSVQSKTDDGNYIVRFVTSFATTEDDVKMFINKLSNL